MFTPTVSNSFVYHLDMILLIQSRFGSWNALFPAMACLAIALAGCGSLPTLKSEPRPVLDAAPNFERFVHVDFSTRPWPRHMTRPHASDPVDIVADPDDPNNRVLRVVIPEGSHTGTSMHISLGPNVASHPTEAVLRYRIRFDPEWQTRTSGKLPGLAGTYDRGGWGGRQNDGYNGWSARGMFGPTITSADGKVKRTPLGSYVYHTDVQVARPNYRFGDGMTYHRTAPHGATAPLPALEHGRWHRVEVHLRLNTVDPANTISNRRGQPGRHDGMIRARINGRLAYENTSLRFRHTDQLRIESVWLDFYHGGQLTAERDLIVYIDDIEVYYPQPTSRAQ